jgi:hypothetical protein
VDRVLCRPIQHLSAIIRPDMTATQAVENIAPLNPAQALFLHAESPNMGPARSSPVFREFSACRVKMRRCSQGGHEYTELRVRLDRVLIASGD